MPCVGDLTLNKASVNECVNTLINLLHDLFDETCKRETRIPCNNCPLHTIMADTTGITKQHKLEFVIMYIYYLRPVPHILA